MYIYIYIYIYIIFKKSAGPIQVLRGLTYFPCFFYRLLLRANASSKNPSPEKKTAQCIR